MFSYIQVSKLLWKISIFRHNISNAYLEFLVQELPFPADNLQEIIIFFLLIHVKIPSYSQTYLEVSSHALSFHLYLFVPRMSVNWKHIPLPSILISYHEPAGNIVPSDQENEFESDNVRPNQASLPPVSYKRRTYSAIIHYLFKHCGSNLLIFLKNLLLFYMLHIRLVLFCCIRK